MERSPVMSSRRRSRSMLAALVMSGVALAGTSCGVPPEGCISAIHFDGTLRCGSAASTWTSQTWTVISGYYFDTNPTNVQLQFSAAGGVGASSRAYDTWAFTATGADALDAFTLGRHDVAPNVTFFWADGWYDGSDSDPKTATEGWYDITRLVTVVDASNPATKNITELSMTFEVVIAGRKIAGSVTIH